MDQDPKALSSKPCSLTQVGWVMKEGLVSFEKVRDWERLVCQRHICEIQGYEPPERFKVPLEPLAHLRNPGYVLLDIPTAPRRSHRLHGYRQGCMLAGVGSRCVVDLM